MYSLEEQITTKHELNQPRNTPKTFHSTNNLQKKKLLLYTTCLQGGNSIVLPQIDIGNNGL